MKRAFKLWPMLLAIPLLVVGCYPSPSLSTSDLDVIITQFEKDHDFGADQRFTIADTVFIIETESSIDLTERFDQLILDLVKENLESRGYIYVTPEDVEAGTAIDFFMIAAKNGRETSGTVVGGCGGYPGYGWGPGWGFPGWGWCPPYVGTYTFEQGSILVSMIHEKSADDDNLSGPWFAATNGILQSSSSANEARIRNNIDRMFEQSPYLRAN